MGSNFTCRFQKLIPINSVSLMKFGELGDDVKNSQYFDNLVTGGIFYMCKKSNRLLSICDLVCFLKSQSTAMVMSGQSVHLTTLFPGQA